MVKGNKGSVSYSMGQSAARPFPNCSSNIIKGSAFPLERLAPTARQGKRKRGAEEVNITSDHNHLEFSHMALPNFKGVV